MKTGVKLMLGVTFAAIAVVAVPKNSQPGDAQEPAGRCYGPHEVDLLMRSNHWTEEEARNILDLACQYSDKKTSNLN